MTDGPAFFELPGGFWVSCDTVRYAWQPVQQAQYAAHRAQRPAHSAHEAVRETVQVRNLISTAPVLQASDIRAYAQTMPPR